MPGPADGDMHMRNVVSFPCEGHPVGHGAVTTLGKECKVGFGASQRLSSALGVLPGPGETLIFKKLGF